MRTHSPAYRDQTAFFQPDNGVSGGALDSPSSSFFVRVVREPAPDIRLGDPSRTEEADAFDAGKADERPISIAFLGAFLGEDAGLRHALRLDEKIDVARFASAGDLLSAFRRGQTSDVVLLDWSMSSAASDLLRELDTSDLRIPVAMLLGGHGEEATLDGRAPVDTHGEIVDRVRLVASLLRGGSGNDAPQSAPAAPAHLRLDTKTCQAFWKANPVNLTITEFNIVSLFARRAGENLSYREIYDVVHGPGFCAGDGANGYQTNVRSLIKRIRQKFHDVDANFTDIENHRGYGYRWRAGEAPSGDGAVPALPHAQPPAVPRAVMLTGAALALVMVVYLANSAAG